MMRKYYFMLLALLLQCFSLGAFAQTSSSLVTGLGDPLITDGSQLSSNASDREEGQDITLLIDGDASTFWHSDWHGDVSDKHYIQVELMNSLQDGYLVMYMQRRATDSGNHLVKAMVSASEDGETWDDLAEFELGNATSGAEVVTDPIAVSKPYLFLRVTNTSTTQNFFHAAELEFYNPTEAGLVLNVLQQVLTKYDTYYYGGYDVLNVGTEYGQYSDTETADKILSELEKADAWAAEPETAEGFPATREEALAFSEEMDSLFEKFWTSEVVYSLPADGYYRIISNLPYKLDVKTGETDDEGNAITETTYVTKALFCSIDFQGMWGTLKEDMANYVWKLTTNEDGTIDMYNAGMEARFTYTGGNACTLSANAETYLPMAFDYAGTNEDGKTVVYIRAAQDKRGAERYFHQYGHSRGTCVSDQIICTWKGTFDMGSPYTSDKGTSEWYLESVSDEEAATLIEAFAPVKDHDKLVSMNATLRATVSDAMETAKDRIKVPMITSADQMTSPFSQNDLGTSTDGQNLSDGALIDGDASTYWHSVWEVGGYGNSFHYIQLSGMEGLVGDARIYVMRRTTDSGHPTSFTLQGSNDPEAADSLWTTITEQTLGNASSGQEFTTAVFKVDTPYSYMRIGKTGVGFWHAAELQIYRLDENPKSQFAALGDLATNLETVYNENAATADEDLTVDMYEALQKAYEAFMTGMVDPADLRSALSKYADYTKGMVEGTNPGQWSDKTAYDAFNNLYKEMSDYNDALKYNKEEIDHYVAAIQLAADNYLSSANKPKTDTWYNIKFAPQDLYEANGWETSNVEGEDVSSPLYDNYVTIAKHEAIEGSDPTMYDYYPVAAEDIREGVTLCALDKASLEDNPDAAKFRFVALPDVLPVVDDLKALKTRCQLALDMVATYTAGDALITEGSQFSSNASDQDEGRNLSALIDGDINTFWHSDWHGKCNNEPHYLQVNFKTPVSGFIQVDVTRRPTTTNGEITRMYITGSNDGETWEKVGYVELPFTTVGEAISSKPVYVDGSYQILRFTESTRRGYDKDGYPIEIDPFGTVGTYWHSSEFQVRPVTMTCSSESAKALVAAMAEANKVVYKDYVAADVIPALATAYNALQAEINAGSHNVVPAASTTITRYALQNKATGLFVNTKARNNNNVTLELMPSFFETSGIGYGENALRADNYDGTYCSYLHIQKLDHALVTWDHKVAGCNSGLMIEEGESSGEQTDFAFTKDIEQGEINAWCYPVDIAVSETEGKAYTVAGIYTDEDQTTYLALDETDKIKAGQPVLYIFGNTEDYIEPVEGEEATSTATPMIFTLTTDFNFTAGSENGLIGTLKSTAIDKGRCIFDANKITAVADEAGATVAANKAYLDFDVCAQVDDSHAMNIVLDNPTGIQNTLENVSKSGNIYSADGKLVRANGTLNDMKNLGAGIYILNGVKVMVK